MSHPPAWQAEFHKVQETYKTLKDSDSKAQLLSRLNLNPTTPQLLEKYESFPESIEFHIYENHFRFGDQQDVIEKNDPCVRDFLKHVAHEEIPPEMIEILYDGGIRLYEECVIVKITDHRQKPPKTYRTLLRPTLLSIYHDMLYILDRLQTPKLDNLLMGMEAMFLPIVHPTLDLGVPLNPYQWDAVDLQKGPVHRQDDYLPPAPRKPPHSSQASVHGSEYEELMLAYSKQTQPPGVSKFSRLRFVEQYRKRLERTTTQALQAKLGETPRLGVMLGLAAGARGPIQQGGNGTPTPSSAASAPPTPAEAKKVKKRPALPKQGGAPKKRVYQTKKKRELAAQNALPALPALRVSTPGASETSFHSFAQPVGSPVVGQQLMGGLLDNIGQAQNQSMQNAMLMVQRQMMANGQNMNVHVPNMGRVQMTPMQQARYYQQMRQMGGAQNVGVMGMMGMNGNMSGNMMNGGMVNGNMGTGANGGGMGNMGGMNGNMNGNMRR